MRALPAQIALHWTRVLPAWLPFADDVLREFSWPRLLRLASFQFTVGMCAALLVGTLNRVMILELGVAAWLVATMLALPLLFAPLRALVGFRSDTHRSALGWRRVPYIWLGTLAQFGGLAIMPFALLLLSGQGAGHAPAWLGHAAAALAFLLAGAGMQVVQTAGLALATDQASERTRPQVVAVMNAMLLAGMVVSGLVFGLLLADFSPLRLVQVVQGAAVVTMVVNLVALWKQEQRRQSAPALAASLTHFSEGWRRFAAQRGARRLLLAVGLGTAAFGMQDIILEPYGGEILGLAVGATAQLTALTAAGALAAFALAAWQLSRGADACRLAAHGALLGIAAFACVIFAAPLVSATLFRIGASLIGVGGGLFAAGTLAAAMALDRGSLQGLQGLVLGAWGGVQAASAGLALAAGGSLRDGVQHLAASGTLGSALAQPATGYSFVYHLEIGLLFATLIAIGPLVRGAARHAPAAQGPSRAL